MTSARPALHAVAERLLRRCLIRLSGEREVLVPEYGLGLHARWGWGSPPLKGVEELIASQRAEYQQAIDDVIALASWAREIPRERGELGQPCWDNDFWGTLDALMQCAALKRRNPARYVEIGSGFSTLFARRAIRDFGLRTRIISIDPGPRAEVDACCDEVVRAPLGAADLGIFDSLEAGDVVLMDGSHVALMGSDATIFFLEVLPSLAAGVLVGIDDVFLPDDYPPSWSGRVYAEQYLVAAHLLGGGRAWNIRFPGWWIAEYSQDASRLEPVWPLVENRFGRHCTSFWLERG